jgi:FkbM family methyltransferase
VANPLWKKIEQSRPYWRVKLLVKRVQGRELWLNRQVKFKTVAYDDWKIAGGELDGNSIVYSLGVGDDIGFDLAMINDFGCRVFAFDPTPTSATYLASKNPPPSFEFHQWAIAARDGTLTLYPRVKKDGTLSDMMFTLAPETASRDHGVDVPAYSIASLMTKLGHTRIDVLKMDIEGAEYEVLEGLLDVPNKPKQLLVEFHHRIPGIGIQKTADIIARLQQADYRIFAVSSTGREVSFMHLPGDATQ